MALNYQNDIKPGLDAGKSSAEIAEELNADFSTVRDIPAGELQAYLAEKGILLKGRSGWGGILVTVADAAGDPALSFGVDLLIAQFEKVDRKILQTTRSDFGRLVPMLTGALQGVPGVDSAALNSELVRLSGGYRYGAVTAQQVDDAIALEARDQALRVLSDRVTAAMEAAEAAHRAGSTPEEITQAAEIAWGA